MEWNGLFHKPKNLDKHYDGMNIVEHIKYMLNLDTIEEVNDYYRKNVPPFFKKRVAENYLLYKHIQRVQTSFLNKKKKF